MAARRDMSILAKIVSALLFFTLVGVAEAGADSWVLSEKEHGCTIKEDDGRLGVVCQPAKPKVAPCELKMKEAMRMMTDTIYNSARKANEYKDAIIFLKALQEELGGRWSETMRECVK
jgi:hypothetical protein